MYEHFSGYVRSIPAVRQQRAGKDQQAAAHTYIYPQQDANEVKYRSTDHHRAYFEDKTLYCGWGNFLSNEKILFPYSLILQGLSSMTYF